MTLYKAKILTTGQMKTIIQKTGFGTSYGKDCWTIKVLNKKSYAVGFWFIREVPF